MVLILLSQLTIDAQVYFWNSNFISFVSIAILVSIPQCFITIALNSFWNIPSLSIILAVEFSSMLFIMLRKFPSITSLLRWVLWGFFNHEKALDFVKFFFRVNWDDHVDLSFILLTCYITLIDLHMLKGCCIPGINQPWTWYIILLICCWIWFFYIVLRIFVSLLRSDIDLRSSFNVIYLSIRVMLAS